MVIFFPEMIEANEVVILSRKFGGIYFILERHNLGIVDYDYDYIKSVISVYFLYV